MILEARPIPRTDKASLHLDVGKILLRFVFPEAITNPELLNSYRKLLAPGEVTREARFHFYHDRHRYLLTRALVRLTLSGIQDIDPRDWQFSTNKFGRPLLIDPSPEMQKLCFNISHSRHAIVLAVCANGALGVDIESLLTRHDVLLEVAQRHFSPPEVADLCALPVEKQADRFLHYWTLKEAYIKARGLGLSIPLDKFGFIIDESTHLDFWTEATLDEEPHRWLFRQIVIADSHVVAVCAARDSKVEQTLTATMCIPGVSERSLAMTQLRHSI